VREQPTSQETATKDDGLSVFQSVPLFAGSGTKTPDPGKNVRRGRGMGRPPPPAFEAGLSTVRRDLSDSQASGAHSDPAGLSGSLPPCGGGRKTDTVSGRVYENRARFCIGTDADGEGHWEGRRTRPAIQAFRNRRDHRPWRRCPQMSADVRRCPGFLRARHSPAVEVRHSPVITRPRSAETGALWRRRPRAGRYNHTAGRLGELEPSPALRAVHRHERPSHSPS
jgi:hypothetical protein